MNSPIASPAPAVRLNMRIFKALDGMENSRLATTIPLREVRQFAEAFLAAADAAHSETPVLAQLGTGSGAGAQSDSGADSGHLTSRSDQPSMEGDTRG